jgi:hypothetical protein
MKKFILGLVLGLVLAGVGTAAAAGQLFWNGTTACKHFKSNGFICTSRNGYGYGVGINNKLVMVTRPDGSIAFTRSQG